MKEIESLVEVYDDIEKVKKALSFCNYVGLNKTIDEYYYDPKRDDLKPNADNKIFNCLRLRTKSNNFYITYKNDIYDGDKWVYSNEYETGIDSIEVLKEIFDKLGLVKFITIDNEKETYTYENYEIVIENVKDLGLFMEVEYSIDTDADVNKIKEEIQTFIDSLHINVSSELNMGKPELYLKKHNIELK